MFFEQPKHFVEHLPCASDSRLLLTIYVDGLLESLRACGRGCYWEDHFSGALSYADDLTIFAPCPGALRKMLTHCEEFAESHGIRFNASKTQLICFRRTSQPDRSCFWFCGQFLLVVDSVLYLGNTLHSTSRISLMFNAS